jgi:hypothetical protein
MTVAHASQVRSHLRQQNGSQNDRSASLSVEVRELPTTCLNSSSSHALRLSTRDEASTA